MLSKKIIRNIKENSLTSHLSGDEDQEILTLYSDRSTIQNFRQIYSQELTMEFVKAGNSMNSTEISLSANEGSLGSSGSNIIASGLSKQKAALQMTETIRDYLLNDPQGQTLRRKRIKCMSVDRFSTRELTIFYKYNDIVHRVKKIVIYF